MSSPQRDKGARYERAVVDYLKTHGHPWAERAYGAGRPDDRGDINGIPGFVLELKNVARLALAEWVDEAETERVASRSSFAAVIFKRKARPVEASYVVLTLETFAALLAEEPIG